MKTATWCFCAATLGCSVGGAGDDGRSTFGSGPGSAETGGGESEAEAGNEEEGGNEEESTTAPDGSSGDEGDVPAARCDKVDILFVLEAPTHPPVPEAPLEECNWWGDEQWTEWYEYAQEYSNRYSMLQQGFATLVSELYVTVEVPDFNVLVTGSQIASPEYWGWGQGATNMCVPGSVELDDCDQALGAGRNGFAITSLLEAEGYSAEECMAERFLASGAMDLPETFACLAYHEFFWEDARLGGYSGNGPDTMMDAMMSSVADAGAASTCNAGFLREDALLVVVLLEVGADPMDDTSSGAPDGWRDALVAAKGGDEDRVVVLSLSPDGAEPHPLCAPEQTSPFATDVRTFTESFEYGLWGSTCLLDYPTFFRAGAQVIDAACGSEPPPVPE
jgi:hypothetical protein